MPKSFQKKLMLRKGLTGLFPSLLNLFLKSPCPLCQRSSQWELCQGCLQQLKRCQFAHSQQLLTSESSVFVWGEYKGILKRVIAALKYDGHPQLARILGQWMGEAWLMSPLSEGTPLMVVPIPLHEERLKKRGFNQAELLAESFCRVTGLRLQRQGLIRIKATDALFGLSPTERQEQMRDAFQLGAGFTRFRSDHQVLLLDDIYTTGTTVKTAIKVLQRASIPVYGTVALASTLSGKNLSK